jgi:hypothetical protein
MIIQMNELHGIDIHDKMDKRWKQNMLKDEKLNTN